MKEINENSYYNEQQIVKVWDTHVKTKQLKYWISNEQHVNSLFLGLNLMSSSKEAGILIHNNGSVYLNTDKSSISICGPVDNILLEQINGYNGITHDLQVALEQVNKLKKSLTKHTIIFPYHITPVHWVFGTLKLNFSDMDNTLNSVKLFIYNPSEYGGINITETVKAGVENLLATVL